MSFCHRSTVSGLTIVRISLIFPILFKMEKMSRSEYWIFNRFLWFCLFRISISFLYKHAWSSRCFFDFTRLKTALIKKVSNENIQPPDNQKILIFWYSLNKNTSGCNLSFPRPILHAVIALPLTTRICQNRRTLQSCSVQWP